MRKYVESVIAQIKSLFPKSIHAVTFKGFLLKVHAFILAFAFKKFLFLK